MFSNSSSAIGDVEVHRGFAEWGVERRGGEVGGLPDLVSMVVTG